VKCKVLLILLFLVSAAQGQSTYFRFIDSTVSTSSTINLQNSGSIFHQISWTVSGTVATCTVAVDSSADGISWSAGGIIPAKTCTSNGDSLPQTHVVANFARINVTAISGAGAQVIVVYTAYTTAAAGGGTVTSVTGTPPVTSSGGNTPAIGCATCAIGPGTSVANHVAKFSGTDGVTLIDGGVAGAGTVTSVGETVNGGASSGIFTITGSPVTTTGTLDIGLAGTSGGIPYFSSGTVASSSAALTSNAPVLGGGAGVAPKTATFLTTNGTTTLTVGVAGGGNGVLAIAGNTSGTSTFTANAVAGTSTNGVVSSNSLYVPTGDATHMAIGTGLLIGMLFSGIVPILDNNGTQIMQFTATGPLITTGDLRTNTNCAGVGTAANPSVVTCTGAPAGAFSCDVAASAGTCTINTAVVTANSQIFVTEVASEGARLGVTCNTAPTVTPAILLASKSAGVSFTINMPTITTNPACFDFLIVN